MNTFEDPDWGHSDVFSYYKFPEASDFKVSSSLLKTSLDRVKNSKVGGKKGQGNKKRKRPEEEPEQADNLQKTKKPKSVKDKEKEAEAAGNVSEVKQNDTISPNSQKSDVEKLAKARSNLGNEEEHATPASLKRKKKKKNSNKRNKYRELNNKQNEMKNISTVNGEIKKCTSLPEERNVSKTICDENFASKELGEQDKGTSQNLEVTGKSPLKPSKKKRKKGGKDVLNKDNRKIEQKENISVSNETEAFVKSKDGSIYPKKKEDKVSKSVPEDSKNSKIVNIGNKKGSKNKLVNDGSEERSNIETSVKKKKKKNCKDQLPLDNKESDDVEEEEVDSKLKKDLDIYLKKLDFSNVMSGSVRRDSESSGSMKISLSGDASISDSEDEYIEDELQEKRMPSKQNVASKKKKTIGNNSKGKTEKYSEDKLLSVSGKNNGKPSLLHDVNLDKKKRAKLNKAVLGRMLKESGEEDHKDLESVSETPALGAAEELKQKMKDQLNAARFRLVNEKMYTATSSEAATLFNSDRNSFEAYHNGFKSQVARWPVNPLDRIITWLKKKPNTLSIADFGCGEAVLAASVPQKNVHSFDLVALNQRVTVCDMAHTPLQSKSVDVAVFCLSLMGTNIKDFILEANRVLKKGGILKIAEVESRINKSKLFVDQVKKYGFNCTYSDTDTKYFFMFDFKKCFDVNKKDVPDIILKPCIYKKR